MKTLNKPSFWKISVLLFWNNLCWKSWKNHQGYYYLLLTFVTILRHLKFLACGSQPFRSRHLTVSIGFLEESTISFLVKLVGGGFFRGVFVHPKKCFGGKKHDPFLWINVTGSLIQKLLLRWVVVFQVMHKLSSSWGGDHLLLGPLFEGWNIIATSTALTKRSWLGNISSNTKGITSWIVESWLLGVSFLPYIRAKRGCRRRMQQQYEFKKNR